MEFELNNLENFSKNLLTLLYEEADTQQLVDMAYPFFDNPIYIFDTNFELTAANFNIPVQDAQSLRILSERHLTDEDYQYINKYTQNHERVKKSSGPVHIVPKNNTPERLVININRHKDVGHIALLASNHPIRKIDYEMLSIFRNAVNLKLKNSSFVQNSRGFNYEYFFKDLIEGRISIESEYQHRLSYLSCKFSPFLLCIVIETSRTPFTINVQRIRNSMEQLLPGLRTIISSGQIIGVIANQTAAQPSESSLSTLHEFCEEQGLYCGISNQFDNIFHLLDYYKQALRALELGTDSQNRPGIYVYNKNALKHVKNLFLQKETAETFCHPQMKELFKYDKENHTNLASTLYHYLVNDRNLVSSAKAIKIHKNTLVYRLNKINNLIFIDYDDPKNRLYLIISYEFTNEV